LPKGVQLSQANLIVVSRVCKDNFLNLLDEQAKSQEISFLGLLPWFHGFGITVMTGVLSGALGKLVILPKFEESLFLNCIEYNKCNILFLVPVS
jgi:4-coumarate--CoA ligase